MEEEEEYMYTTITSLFCIVFKCPVNRHIQNTF